MAKPPPAPLVTSLGLVTNLGIGAAQVAAAHRAGLSRRVSLPEYVTSDPGPDMEAPVLAAQIEGFTDGFMHPGRWLRLAFAALEDLVVYGGLPDASDVAFWHRTAVLWALPEITQERFFWSEGEAPSLLAERCALPLLGGSRLPIPPENVEPVPAGGAAPALAAKVIAERLARGEVDRAVLLATDSWLDPMSMRVLLDANRVKSGAQPFGLCPGEAGAALLFESEAAAHGRGARREARLDAGVVVPGLWPPGEGDDVDPRVVGAPDAGRRLADAIENVLTAARVPLPFAGDVFLDLNGEEWRARAWGFAAPMLQGLVDSRRGRVILPAVVFGDVGASAGALAACLSTRSFVRRHARSDRALVCSLAETGAASAMVLGAL